MQTLLLPPKTSELTLSKPIALEGGGVLPQVTINYTSAGELNADKSNVVWVFHALTANSDPFEWWPDLFGSGRAFDPEQHYIICANMLGSCYGTTGPEDYSFPIVTIRDMVKLHQELRESLGIEKIKIGIGGSMGGQQLLEWSVMEPERFEKIIPIATNAEHSAWGIAFNEAQRMAIDNPNPEKGLEAARAVAMLSYRNYHAYEKTQKDEDKRIDQFSASSYQRYQGEKLRKRFKPESYYYLSKAMDSHHLGRHFESSQAALNRVVSDALVISITSDILFPTVEQEFLAHHLPHAKLELVDSAFGHDGFLVEMETISRLVKDFIA
ncbi:MAG: homoserine O-acetyltransferase [Cyclobacteriaceae bacterium]|nr:homoserine O-acetyltransferase [Cyclobacteriaceae bacterium HetDA_MAG_MS6]